MRRSNKTRARHALKRWSKRYWRRPNRSLDPQVAACPEPGRNRERGFVMDFLLRELNMLQTIARQLAGRVDDLSAKQRVALSRMTARVNTDFIRLARDRFGFDPRDTEAE